jgi:hypothetical protein
MLDPPHHIPTLPYIRPQKPVQIAPIGCSHFDYNLRKHFVTISFELRNCIVSQFYRTQLTLVFCTKCFTADYDSLIKSISRACLTIYVARLSCFVNPYRPRAGTYCTVCIVVAAHWSFRLTPNTS